MILTVDWGNVPGWFAAVGTVGALLVAFWLLRREIDDKRSMADVVDQKPASGVFVWVEPRSDAGGWQTWATNRSDEPVYGAVVYFTPLTDPPMPTVESVWGTIPPGEARVGDSYGDHPSDVFGVPPVEIEFTDGRGRHWRRGVAGELREISQRAPFC